jgi:hypothetical protein
MNLKPVDRLNASDGTEIVAGSPDGDVSVIVADPPLTKSTVVPLPSSCGRAWKVLEGVVNCSVS